MISTEDPRTIQASVPLVELSGLNVSYDPRHPPVLRDASLIIAPGERIAIVGESGSGKTTLGLSIAGFLPRNARQSARVFSFEGRNLLEKASRSSTVLPSRTPGISMMFQDAMTSLDPLWNIESQLLAVLRHARALNRSDARDEARTLLRRVGLSDVERVMQSRPGQLSGGMRQRAMLAIALASRPRLLIADEPTSALDASLAREALELLSELSATIGAALLLVTHDIELCLDYTDRTIVMHKGEIVEVAPSRLLADKATHSYTIGLLKCVPTLASAHLEELPTLKNIAETRHSEAS